MNPTLRGFLRKELTQTLRDPRMRVLLFLTPVMQLTLFGVAISTEVKNVRLSARYEPKDYVMRDVYLHSLASGWFIPADTDGPGSRLDPFTAIRSNRADAVLVAPPGGLSRAIGRGDATLQLLVNATNVVKAQAIEVYVQAILARVVAEDERLRDRAPPVRFDVRILYNPSLRTEVFMVPGVMGMLMCITTLILTNMSIAREKEIGTFETLIAAPVTSREIVLGKTLPYVFLGMCNFPIILVTGVLLFDMPVRGPLVALGAAAFFFVSAMVAVGMLISTVSRNQQQAMLGGFLFLFPAILLSGLIFPLENMPAAIRYIAYCDPLSHFIGLIRNIMLKGGELSYVLEHSLILLVMAVALAWIGARRFRTTLQ